MKVAAARALAGLVAENELSEEYIVPSVFDRRVAETVSAAVQEVVRHEAAANK
jgi:malate dehydrogenase (oxaloacetate-decarboxylating)